MADTFYREPIDHGDSNVWGPYLLRQLRCGGLGGLSMELSNSGGNLSLSAGYAGIDNGTVKGVFERSTAGNISLAAITVGTWAVIEFSVSGAVVTLTATDIAGANDEGIIPASIKAAYDTFKGGYYLTSTKRVIGIAFKRTSGALSRIINCESGKLGFRHVQMVYNVDASGADSIIYLDKKRMDIGDWNMDAGVSVSITHNLNATKIRSVDAFVRADSDVVGIAASPLIVSGSIAWASSAGLTTIVLSRVTGGFYDNSNYDSSPGYNRGWIEIKYET